MGKAGKIEIQPIMTRYAGKYLRLMKHQNSWLYAGKEYWNKKTDCQGHLYCWLLNPRGNKSENL